MTEVQRTKLDRLREKGVWTLSDYEYSELLRLQKLGTGERDKQIGEIEEILNKG